MVYMEPDHNETVWSEATPCPAVPGHTCPGRCSPAGLAAACRSMGLFGRRVQGSDPKGKADVFIKISRTQVSLPAPHRPGSHTGSLLAEGLGRRWFRHLCLLSATVAVCICFSAAQQLQEDVVTVALCCLISHSFCKPQGRNQNRKYFLERKVHFSSRTETANVKSEKQMADKSKI